MKQCFAADQACAFLERTLPFCYLERISPEKCAETSHLYHCMLGQRSLVVQIGRGSHDGTHLLCVSPSQMLGESRRQYHSSRLIYCLKDVELVASSCKAMSEAPETGGGPRVKHAKNNAIKQRCVDLLSIVAAFLYKCCPNPLFLCHKSSEAYEGVGSTKGWPSLRQALGILSVPPNIYV